MSRAETTPASVAVIGAGWAGCAAAVELAHKGRTVTLFEAARTLGGRARGVQMQGTQLDNGQHILLGAYRESMRLMRMVGIDPDAALMRLPLQMRYPAHGEGIDFLTPRLPAPWHILAGLWRAGGLDREDKLALLRFSTSARWMEWRLNTDCSVSELLERFEQTERLTRFIWRPLCIAALNTPPDSASAQVFLNVLKDSLGARRAASDMLIPRVDLSALFPQHAAVFIEQRSGEVRCGASVKQIRREAAEWKLEYSQAADVPADSAHFDAVVVATSATQAASLLNGLIDTENISALCHEPITTCYMQYPANLRLPGPLFALADDAEAREWGQFVFDRGWLNDKQAGLLAVVVSASSEAIALGHEALSSAVAAQLARVFRQPALSTPEWSQVITEKRATFACTPALSRPGNATTLPGLAIAGDYTASDYPATLEAAIRSGVEAARCI